MPGAGDLQAATEPVRRLLVERHEAREVALQASREATRAAANAIRATHRGESDRAAALVDEARAALERATTACGPHPEVLHAGFVADAAKELAEAVLTRETIAAWPPPGPEAVGVDEVAWLHGLAEAVGELRRASLDHVRAERVEDAEVLLERMQEILSALATIDVPDGVSRGLRRATDAARAITERTRGDVTTAVGQRRLRRALDAHRVALEGSGAAGGASAGSDAEAGPD